MEIDIARFFTIRDMTFDTGGPVATTMPLVRLSNEPLFSTFSPVKFRIPQGFVPEHIVRMRPGPVMVHENILKTRLVGGWAAHKRVYKETRQTGRRSRQVVSTTNTMTFWIEKDEDFILLKLAGLFTNAASEIVERDKDRERKKAFRNLSFTVTERRRLLSLLRASIKKGGSSLKVDQALFAKID